MGDDLATVWDVAYPDDPVRTAVHTRCTEGAGVDAFTPGLSLIVGTAPDGSDTVALRHFR
jgi:hypothetical protein